MKLEELESYVLNRQSQTGNQFAPAQELADEHTLQQYGRAVQVDLQAEAMKLVGQQATVDTVQQLGVIKNDYEKLIKLISNEGNTENNERYINQFEKEERQRIKVFGGDRSPELQNYLATTVNNARKYNIQLASTENEKKAWGVVTEKVTEIDAYLRDQDYDKVLNGLSDIDGIFNRFNAEDIIGRDRADQYSHGVKNKVINNVMSIANDQLNYLTQTQGIEASQDFYKQVKNSFKDYIGFADDSFKKAFELKGKQLKASSLDLGEIGNNYEAVYRNYLTGFTDFNSYKDTTVNYIKKLSAFQDELPESEKNQIKKLKRSLKGGFLMAEKMTDEFNALKDGSKSSAQLLRPDLDSGQLGLFMKQISDEAGKTGQGFSDAEMLSAGLTMRSALLKKAISANGRTDIHGIANTIYEFFNQSSGETPVDMFEEKENIYDKIKQEVNISKAFGHEPLPSQGTVNELKQLIMNTNTPEEALSLRNTISSIEDEFKTDLTSIFVKTQGTDKARQLVNPNVTSFIQTYPNVLSNLSHRSGYKQAVTLARNDPVFSQVVGKLESIISASDASVSTFELQKILGYDASVLQNSFVIDTALGIMGGQYGIGADALVNIPTGTNNKGVFKSETAELMAEVFTEKIEKLKNNFTKMGRTPIINSDQDIFNRKNPVDIKMVGIFDKPLSQTGLFERVGERAKDMIGAPTAIKNLIPKQQERVESFFQQFLPNVDTISGRLRTVPVENGFYQIMLENGFGGLDSVDYDEQPLVINPAIYKDITSDLLDIDKSAESDKKVADALLEIIRLSNKMR